MEMQIAVEMDKQHSTFLPNDEQTSIATVHVAQKVAISLAKGICFFGIILTALFGNCLVLIAVTKFKRIRQVRTNIFLVSLALADFLVALLVMPFSAIMGLMQGRWIFGSVFCDVFNANDVLFSTASILHLCCISTERYIAVLSPLTYGRIMTRSRIAVMLTVTWLLSILISYVPIMTGIYTTTEHKNRVENRAEICEFVVNPYYALISSSTSFWIPSIVMISVYVRIFIEARSQERRIHRLHIGGKRQQIVRTKAAQPEESCLKGELDKTDLTTSTPDQDGRGKTCGSDDDSLSCAPYLQLKTTGRKETSLLTTTTSSSSSGTADQMKIRRENKAAKTLGIIMGAFLLCWLPFFLWYTITNMCGGSKRCQYPEIVGDVLFWIGYFNSTLNPIIYAFYNRTFRNAFGKILLCKRRFNSRSLVVDAVKIRRTNQPYINTNGLDISQQSLRP
ncbi:Octopamine beta receptor 3 [Fasciola hepatica]|uniref:Octopamine beta receptor 3 n=1 Tax=Fasciola hepatica TaxID=6192 RepID=A0A2H1CC03_FASHE|nr:Octopamine beta receptor 3 [Fasciola hepatica]